MSDSEQATPKQPAAGDDTQSAQSERTSSENAPADRQQLTEEIQRDLKALGYEPGPIDGIYGPKTKRAIEAFERDMGMKPKGDATVEIWQRLQQAGSLPDRPTPRDAAGETGGGAGAAPPRSTNGGDRSGVEGQSDLRQGSEPGIARQSDKQRTRASKPSHFTLESHKDEVRRVHGEPSSINRYPHPFPLVHPPTIDAVRMNPYLPNV